VSLDIYIAQPNGTLTSPGRPTLQGGDRSGLVLGTYIVTEDEVGVLPGSTLAIQSGDLIVTTPGAIISNLDIYGQLIIRAAGVRAYNCRIRGTAGNANRGLIDCTSASAIGFVAEDCSLIPDYPSYGWNAAMGDSYTLRRCYWKWVVDGYRGYNIANPGKPLDIVIEGCLGGPLSFFSPDPNHGPPLHPTGDDRVHSDHGQIESGMAKNHVSSSSSTWLAPLTLISDASVVVRFNSFWGWYAGGDLFPERWPGFNASTSNPLTNPPNTVLDILRDANTSILQVTPNLGVPVTGIWYEGNHVYGGAVGVSLAGGAGSGKRNPGRFIDNIFDGYQRQSNLGGTASAWAFSIKSPEYGDRDTSELLGTYTGNINNATGGAARLGRVTA
jgi:hypothetical protein